MRTPDDLERLIFPGSLCRSIAQAIRHQPWLVSLWIFWMLCDLFQGQWFEVYKDFGVVLIVLWGAMCSYMNKKTLELFRELQKANPRQ